MKKLVNVTTVVVMVLFFITKSENAAAQMNCDQYVCCDFYGNCMPNLATLLAPVQYTCSNGKCCDILFPTNCVPDPKQKGCPSSMHPKGEKLCCPNWDKKNETINCVKNVWNKIPAGSDSIGNNMPSDGNSSTTGDSSWSCDIKGKNDCQNICDLTKETCYTRCSSGDGSCMQVCGTAWTGCRERCWGTYCPTN